MDLASFHPHAWAEAIAPGPLIGCQLAYREAALRAMPTPD